LINCQLLASPKPVASPRVFSTLGEVFLMVGGIACGRAEAFLTIDLLQIRFLAGLRADFRSKSALVDPTLALPKGRERTFKTTTCNVQEV
jgi:hypothetical protein